MERMKYRMPPENRLVNNNKIQPQSVGASSLLERMDLTGAGEPVHGNPGTCFHDNPGTDAWC